VQVFTEADVLDLGPGMDPLPIHPNSVLGRILANERKQQAELRQWVRDHGPTPAACRLRQLINVRRSEIGEILKKYDAKNPRLFGSVARGDANDNSDIDILVDISDDPTKDFFATNGLAVDLAELLDVPVDVSTELLFKPDVKAGIAPGEVIPI